MSVMKNYLEENFDNIGYAELKDDGFDEEAIHFMWSCFSDLAWEDFKLT